MMRRFVVWAPLAMTAFLMFITIGGTVVLLLWNWLMPAIFGWREITFWQALGLLALCRILFGGLGRHGGRRSHSDFTPEQKARFRQRMRERFGFDTPTTDNRGEV
jgi:hypothetical protein